MSDRIAEVIATSLQLDASAITDELGFNAVPQWDSMAHINLMLALEDAFGVSIPDDDLVELTDVRAIRAYLQGKGVA